MVAYSCRKTAEKTLVTKFFLIFCILYTLQAAAADFRVLQCNLLPVRARYMLRHSLYLRALYTPYKTGCLYAVSTALSFKRKAHQTESCFLLLIKINLSQKPCPLAFKTSRLQVLATTCLPECWYKTKATALPVKSRVALQPTQSPIQQALGFFRVKAAVAWSYSIPPGVEVRMSGATPLFPYILAWYGQPTLLQGCNSTVLHPRWP